MKGKPSPDECNNNGERLIELRTFHRLLISSTVFEHRTFHKIRWVSVDQLRTSNQVYRSNMMRLSFISENLVMCSVEFFLIVLIRKVDAYAVIKGIRFCVNQKGRSYGK